MESSLVKYQNLNSSSSCTIKICGRDPVYQLSAVFGKICWKTTLTAGAHNKCCFQVATNINGKRFSAIGTTLKEAKNSCALLALGNYNSIEYQEIRPFRNISKVCGLKVTDVATSISYSGKNTLPLIIEEIEDDCKIINKRKALQNLTNLSGKSNSNLNTAVNTSKPDNSPVPLKLHSAIQKNICRKVSDLGNGNLNLKTDYIAKPDNSAVQSKLQPAIQKNICRKENHVSDLASILKRKFKRKVDKTLDTNIFPNMDLINVQSIKVKACIKSYSKNPIRTLNSSYVEIENEFMVSTRKQVSISAFKRPREDDIESDELPPAKRRATDTIKTLSHQNGCPVDYLRNLNPSVKYTLESEMGAQIVSYCMMSAVVGNRKFFGHGKTTFLAKNDAAEKVLEYMGNNPFKNTNNREYTRSQKSKKNFQRMISPYKHEDDEYSSLLMPTHVADIMEGKIMQKFKMLTRGREASREYKVLAGVLMTYNMNFRTAEVVSIATGTKCVNGGNICFNGSVLNDSHAEVIAKRGLMKYLYTELRHHCTEDSNANSIFRRNPYVHQKPYSLKSNVHFHLYINTAPCGDARVFSFNHTNFANRAEHGQLRTKIEGELGTNPVSMRCYPQTWDGVLLGEPLHTMSCSDKIALWNVTGVQGALLSQFIDPIYLHSIVLGSIFNTEHVYRAICGRIENTLGCLPQSYRLNRPMLGRTSRPLWRSTFRPPSTGINWTLGDDDAEIISLPTGRRIDNQVSFLSKLAFYGKFDYICRNLPGGYIGHVGESYAEAKENSCDFQQSKREVYDAFCRANLGIWVKKPIEQNGFMMN